MAYTDDWESLMNGVFGPGADSRLPPALLHPKQATAPPCLT